MSLQLLPSPFQKLGRFISPTHPEFPPPPPLFFNSYPQKTYMVWFLHLPSVWFLLISSPNCHLLLQFLWCCFSCCSAACADSCKMEFTRLMIYEHCAMAPQRSDSCTFLLTAVCTQSCLQASGRECNFPDGSLQKQEYSWKNSMNHE